MREAVTFRIEDSIPARDSLLSRLQGRDERDRWKDLFEFRLDIVLEPDAAAGFGKTGHRLVGYW